ncbi:hypothetical protein KFE98_10585 [bacterium SCSIO 12741]|nr:hypothetical protein KFE98_10585 [bacterium SCSIO 12741]
MKYLAKLSFALLLFSILGACSSNSSNDRIYEDTVEYEESAPMTEAELKQQLKDRECYDGSEYLNGSLKYKPIYKNAFSTKVKGLKLFCTLRSKATLATYKDVKAKVRFVSKTGTVILEKEFDVYEFITPNDSIKYSTEIVVTNQQFKDIASFNWGILRADCK